MLFFGDARARVPSVELVARVREDRGLVRREGREALARLLLDLGELTQGVLDAELAQRGLDAPSPARAILAELAGEVSDAFVASLAGPAPSPALAALDRLEGLPETLDVIAPEGFAFYAVYPELYARAGALLRARGDQHLSVIGVRSIGASLAPVVAAAAGPPARTTLVRPRGHPFARSLEVDEELARAILGDGRSVFAVVDDGPGLSGSSLGCVGDWLEARGVAPDRVWYFPSHRAELGPRASLRHRARWAGAKRVVAPAEERFFRALLDEPELVDVSAGAWRRHVYARESSYPPVNAALERRKFLAGRGPTRSLFKFAGLGRRAEPKRARAAHLARRGFTPEVTSVRHGFVEIPWLDGARLNETRAPRDALLETLAAYLSELATAFPAPAGAGASPEDLLAMAKHNAADALGPEHARELERHAGGLDVRPILGDGRMHAWEWLVLPSGRILKTDALDHHAGHDLVGAQDVAWDIAGARIELDLTNDETAQLVDAIARRSPARAPPKKLAFFTDAYLAFQLGAWTVAQEQTSDPSELARLRAAATRCAERLRSRLECAPSL
jgi:hypothetical protein